MLFAPRIHSTQDRKIGEESGQARVSNFWSVSGLALFYCWAIYTNLGLAEGHTERYLNSIKGEIVAYPQTTPPIQVPIPIRGVNKRDPLREMDSSYCPWLLNWTPEPQYLRVRNGYTLSVSLAAAPGPVSAITALGAYGNSELFAYCLMPFGNDQIIRVSGAVASVHTTGASGSTAVFSVPFASRMAFYTIDNAANRARTWDGTTWTAWPFTDGGVGTVPAFTMTSFKGRVYFFGGTTAATQAYMRYSVLAGVAGPTTLVDLQTVFKEKSPIVWSGVLTSATGRIDDAYLAFGNAAGEVLVYAGSNPGAPDWEQIGSFKVSPPAYYNSVVEYQNDLWLVTESGVVSIRKLFAGGDDVGEGFSVSSALDPYIARLIQLQNSGVRLASRASVAFWPEENKVFILMAGHLDRDGALDSTALTMFVYNGYSKGWTINKVPGFGKNLTWAGNITYFKNAIYFTLEDCVMKISTGYKDENPDSPGAYTTYPVQLESAYLSNIAGKGRYNQVTGAEPVIKTDFSGSNIGMKMASDFGRKVSATSNIALQSGLQSPIYSVGTEGSYTQYRIEGTSDAASTLGYELYSMGINVK